MQLDAGAAGLTVGTLGEAEVLASAGLRDLFLAYPVWAEGPKAARLRAVHESADLRSGSIRSDAVERLAAAVAGTRKPLRVLVEVDSGGHRTGVASPGEAVEVASAAARAGLAVEGVFTHGGHSYRPAAAGAAGLDEVASLEAAAAALDGAGFEVRTVSAGSTPTRTLAAEGRVTEIRAGTYALGDRQQVALGAIDGDGIAAVVAATVVSAGPGRAVLDAGAKALTKDLPDVRRGVRRDPRLAGRAASSACTTTTGSCRWRAAGRRPGWDPSSRSSRTTSAPSSTSCPASPRCRRTAASSTGPSTPAAAAADRAFGHHRAMADLDPPAPAAARRPPPSRPGRRADHRRLRQPRLARRRGAGRPRRASTGH